MPRRLVGLSVAISLFAVAAAVGEDRSAFTEFLTSLRRDATAQGVSTKTFDDAFRGLKGPDPSILARIGRQGEFSRPVWEYLVGSVTAARIARGKAKASALDTTLRTIETRYGVPASVVLSIWGVESDFGASAGTVPTIRALATLAAAGHRGTLFRNELIDALKILQRGDITPAGMSGSWAGAMGQVQFLPSTYLGHAVDFDGDGRRDIWHDDADALASIAAYLKDLGWKRGLSWGYEVRLPKDFELSRYTGDLSDFAGRGVVRADGHMLPADGKASLFLPGGLGGPVFLLTDNFEVLRGYNTSDSYALAVGHLADRLAGSAALVAPWPVKASRLDAAGIKALQQALGAKGFYRGDDDGRAGPKLRDAVRRYQIDAGLPADGYASPALLAHIQTR